MTDQQQTGAVLESPHASHQLNTSKHWGGKRKGAGRKSRVVHDNVTTYDAKDAITLGKVFHRKGIEVRWNERALYHEWRRLGESSPFAWQEFKQGYKAALRNQIGRNYRYKVGQGISPLRYGKDAFDDALDALTFERQEDDFLDWISSLPQWDGDERLATWLHDLFGADKDDPLAQWVSRFILQGALERTFHPGTKLDTMPVLVSDERQGLGKSACLANLFPRQRRAQWFTDTLHLAASPQKQIEALQGAVIVECGEMAGATRGELTQIKSFLTRTADKIRLSYRRDPEALPRRCIFVGTVDRTDCLPNDPAGLRRFVPILLTHGANVEQYMKENREQLWAEAKYGLTLRGENPALPRDLIELAEARANQHRRTNPVLEDEVRTLNTCQFREGALLEQIEDKLKYFNQKPFDMSQQHLLGGVLKKLGWVKRQKRVDGNPRKMWFPPEHATP